MHGRDGAQPRADGEFPIPSYLPPDAVRITGYSEFLEVLRSPAMAPEPSALRHPIMGDTLMNLHGMKHTRRRRVLNELVRPEALERYRDSLLLPTLEGRIERLRDTPSPDGTCRTDLVQFSKDVFVRFAGQLIGLHGMQTAGSAAALMHVLDPIIEHQHVNLLPGDRQRIVDEGIAAKRQYREAFFEPALAAASERRGRPDKAIRDLMTLLAERLDPDWDDRDLAVRETLVFLIGAIDTSTHLITQAVDEISRWVSDHPEDQERLDDLAFLSGAAQEALRVHPAGPVLTRQAAVDVTLSSGLTIRKGQWVALIARAAARDPRVFGPDADHFDPYRKLPRGVPSYTTSFGSGPHQCIGLRVVLGEHGIGGHVHMLRRLFELGVRPDAEDPAHAETSEREFFAVYPAVFTRMPEATGAATRDLR